MSLAKTVAPSLKNLPDRSSRHAALFSSKSLSFNTVYSDTKLDLNLGLGNFRIFLQLFSRFSMLFSRFQ